MSTIAANTASPKNELQPTSALRTHPVMTAAAIAIAAAGAVGAILVATSNHLIDPSGYGVQIGVVVVGTTAISLFWIVVRPGNRIATVLLLYAAAVVGVSLQGAANPVLHSLGVLCDVPAFLLTYYLVLIFPEGRLNGAVDKLLLTGAAWALLATFLPSFLFSPVVSGTAPLGRCNLRCPENAFMIADRPSLASGFGTTQAYIAVAIAAAIAVRLAYVLAKASRLRVRALLPVYVPALMLTLAFGVFQLAGAGLVQLNAKARADIGWFVTAGRTAFTYGFLLAVLQAMLYAGTVLRTILARLDRETSPARLRDLVARALDDPPLELALNAGDGVFVDSQGELIDPTSFADGRTASAIRRGERTLGYIVHDLALNTDPEIVQAAGRSVLLALESGRLGTELLSKTEELQASRARIVATAERERVRLERDLHDGAQQRLMSIQVKIALAQQKQHDGDELGARLQEIQIDAAAAVEELRTLARGIYPTVLIERGLADALRSVAMTAAIPIRVTDEGVGRCSGAVEAAVYFCSLEAIQNVAKHAGSGAKAMVLLGRRDGAVHFSVADDGAGIDPQNETSGLGMTSMRDRIGAVGGTLDIASSAGGGTTVSGTVPDETRPDERA